MNSLAIELRGLAKSFGTRPVFRGVDLKVAQGEVVALLGPSGAGKTTLFRCIAGLVPIDAGSIRMFDREVGSASGRTDHMARRDVGIVYQQFNLVRRLSAIENVLMGRLDRISAWRVLTRTYAESDIERARQHLMSVGLTGHAWQRADRLSGGQQQRVAIARTLMQECKIILADEPVSSLDPDTSMQILSLLRSLAKEHGITLLCSLHQPQYVAAIADRTMRFFDGSLSAASNVEDLTGRTPPRAAAPLSNNHA